LAAKSYSVTLKDGNQCLPPESNINLALTAPERDDWTANGNSNANANSFIGTTTNYDFVMKANNSEALRLKTNGDALFSGKIGLGTNSPTAKLDITGGIRIRDINSLYTNLPMPTGTQRLVTTDSNGNLRTFPLDLHGETNCSQMVLGWSKRPNLIAGTGTTMPDGLGGTVTVYEPDLSHPNDIVKCPIEGNVGIGVLQPNFKLDVVGDINSSNAYYLNGSPLWQSTNDGVKYSTGKLHIGQLLPTGNHSDALVSIDGKLVVKSCYVNTVAWADNVFKPSYPLMSLNEVEKYYQLNQHLPEIPTEKEVIEKGINTSEMITLLLKKVEELTLYTVQQQKEIETLKSQLK
jgi:hypothetical protein